MSPQASFKSTPHPLDPLTASEVHAASEILRTVTGGPPSEIKFKVIDLAEPPKSVTVQHLHRNGTAPDRKARVYYHHKKSETLSIALVNLTTGRIEHQYEAPGSQGPVDWLEFELVNKACHEHPDVQAEVAKLKLPPKYVTLRQE